VDVYAYIRHVLRGFSIVTLCALLIPATVFVVIVGGFIFLPLPANLPEPKLTPISQATRVYDVNGEEIAVIQKYDRNIPVAREDLPLILKQALISSEDRNFYTHEGVDVRGSLRALWADVRNRGVSQGGSTLTQQYVKNVYTNKERSLQRKIREAILASQLDRQTEKDEILHRYLSNVFFGGGAYGIGAAAETYFRKPVSQLTASESAVLVGLIPAPSSWAPRENPVANEFRRKLVLNQMLGERYLTPEQHAAEIARPLWLEGQGDPPGPVTLVYNDQKATSKYPYYTDYVEKYLEAKYGEDAVATRGLRVQTALDPELQSSAQSTVTKALVGTRAPLNMALVAVEPPTGYVRAMVGGRDFQNYQVNLALGGCPERVDRRAQSPVKVQVEPSCWGEPPVRGGGTGRQPGSAFKPFVLATAYAQGVQPTKVYSAPPVYYPPGCRAQKCTINNYEGEAFGSSNLKEATVHSINTVYAPLQRDVGFVQTAEMAKKLGVTSAFYSQQIHQTSGNYALGVIEVSPLDMAAAFGVFANRGLRQPATPIVKVIDVQGTVLEDNTNRQPTRVIDEAVADNVTDALGAVVERGTGTNGRLDRPAAGKTGTTEDYHDAWFVGYTPTLSTSVWMGYSDGVRTINYRGNTRIAGGSVPTQTWGSFMRLALKDVPITEFSQPAPIKKPEANVLLNVNPAAPAAITVRSQRDPATTPAGDYDRTGSATPSVAAPPTSAPPVIAVPAPVAPQATPTTSPSRR